MEKTLSPKNLSNSFKRKPASSAGNCYPQPNGRGVVNMLVAIWKKLHSPSWPSLMRTGIFTLMCPRSEIRAQTSFAALVQAMMLERKMAWPTKPACRGCGVLCAQKRRHSAGVTTWQDTCARSTQILTRVWDIRLEILTRKAHIKWLSERLWNRRSILRTHP